MALLITNADVITAENRFNADIWCADEQFTSFHTPGSVDHAGLPPETEILDAKGLLVFPGFIDPHTHIYMEFMGTFAKDDYVSASRAALLGGTTTLFDMCIPSPRQSPLQALALWNEQSRGKCGCDWSYHLAVTHFGSSTGAELAQAVLDGLPSFKVFLAYKGALGIDDAALYQTLDLARRLGVITTAHCENAEVIAQRQQRLLADNKTGPEYHYASRPPAVEAEGVHHLLTFAELLGASTYIVHLSCREALATALRFRDRGVPVWIETLIQHLLLDRTCAELPNFEGAKYVMSPPLRDRANQAVLWNGLRNGTISTVATDHAPFDFATQKILGRDDFTKIPNGIPALQERLALLYTYGVKRGWLDLHQFVNAGATQAAKIFGLFPRKGTVQLGSDADLVLFDPSYRGLISAATQASAVDYNAFDGFAVEGRPRHVTLRGKVVVRQHKYVGEAGQGKFLKRQPTHFVRTSRSGSNSPDSSH